MSSGGSNDHVSFSFKQKEICREYLLDIFPTEGLLCNASFDDFYCWPPTPAGEIATEKCVAIFPDVDGIDLFPDAFAFRECNPNGTWVKDWTNYSQCVDIITKHSPQFAVAYIMFFVGLVSFALLTITLFIFTCFHSLECDRLRVHRNLVVALLVKFFATLVHVEPYISGRTDYTYKEYDLVCKFLLVVILYTSVACINWMFVEGLFLHSRLTSNVFDSRAPFKTYYAIGWGLPMVFITWWMIDMGLNHSEHCWNGYAKVHSTWILVAPMLLVLLINLFFLANILRILVTKLRASQAVEAIQVRKAVRAAFVLLPLLGIPNLFFVVTPEDGSLEGIFMTANALFQSSQGIFVSVLHCFCNGEVQELFKKRWRRLRTTHQTDFRGPGSTRRKSTKSVIIPPTLSEIGVTIQLQDITENGTNRVERPDIQTSLV